MNSSPPKGSDLHRLALSIFSGVVVAFFGFLGLYFLSLPVLGLFGWDEWTAPKLPGVVVIVASIAIGGAAGCILFPLLLRPFITAATFWNWVDNEVQVKIPGLDPLFGRWVRFLYPRQ